MYTVLFDKICVDHCFLTWKPTVSEICYELQLQQLESQNSKKMENQEHPTFGNGKICYLELPSRNIAESASFYNAVFNWNIRQRSDETWAFDDIVNEVSGTWRTDRQPAVELGLLVYIMVDDIEISMQAVVDNGGTITQPVGLEAPELTARFKDPTGNILGLFQQ